MGSVQGSASSSVTGARLPVWVSILARACAKRGARIEIEPIYGYAGSIVGADGRRHFFKGTNFDINGAGAAALAKDKDYAARFLAEAGLRVPRGLLLHSPARRAALRLKNPDVARRLPDNADALAFAEAAGYPVFVKPNEGSEGDGVMRVGAPDGLDGALATLFARHERVLVQETVAGRDFRVVVLDGKVLAAFERRPLSVTGDGSSPLSVLIAHALEGFSAGGRGTRIAADDPRILSHLASGGRGPQTVPALGEKVALLANANLSTGGAAVEVSDALSPDFAEAAVRAAAALGLRFSGVDLMASGPGDPAPAVLEVNAAPGLSYFHRLGGDAAETVERIYEALLDALLGR